MSAKGAELVIVSDILGGPVTRFLERNPHFGIFASAAGFTTSLLAAVKILSVFLGFGGAVFGFIAGYYTMRSARRKYLRDKAENGTTTT